MGTHYKGSKQEVRALDTFIKLVRATNSLTTRTDRLLAEHGLTAGQFGVLEALLHLGPLHQCDLAQKLLNTGGNVTMIIDNLEKRDMVRRERSKEDRRFVRVHLTEAGNKLISEIFPQHVRDITREVNILTAQEQEELGRLCRKLGKRESA
jgi:MarR family 2-MHQ and catechol resistance regulon transcriptional repressor